MTSYTKGPWLANGRLVYCSDARFIATASSTDIQDYAEVEANANLIACAPELVDALQALVDKHKQHYGLDGAWDDEIVKAQQLLKKVRGE